MTHIHSSIYTNAVNLPGEITTSEIHGTPESGATLKEFPTILNIFIFGDYFTVDVSAGLSSVRTLFAHSMMISMMDTRATPTREEKGQHATPVAQTSTSHPRGKLRAKRKPEIPVPII